MNAVICLFVAFLAVDAAELIGKDNPIESELPLASPNLVGAFKGLLHKALGSEGTYHRDLLITAGIIEAPPGYESPKDVGSGKHKEIPLSPEMKEYFNVHITGKLTSLESLDYALKRLFGKRLLPNLIIDAKDLWDKESTAYALSNDPKEIHGIPEQVTTEIDCNLEDNIHSGACEESLRNIPELPSLPSVDFVMTPEPGFYSENEFVTSTSLVDKIVTEYKIFSETPESSTLPSSIHDTSTSEQGDGIISYTTFDDPFTSHFIGSSISSISNKISSTSEEPVTSLEMETRQHPTDVVTVSGESSETESDSMHSPKYGRVLTFEEVKLLDQALNIKSELKYSVASLFQPDLNPISDVYFSKNESETHPTVNETSSSKSAGKKRRTVNPLDLILEEPIFYQAPTPHTMILRYYRYIPDTSFTCANKSMPGFYADQETDCQVFHVCWPGRRESFLCPVGSLFNQRVLSCDYFNNTNCSLTHAYYDLNTAFQEYDDAKALNVTPMPDPMMKPLQNDSGTTAIVTNKADIVELFDADLHFSDMVNKTNITELWDYIPVKAKVFIYPEPSDLKTFLAQHRHHHPHHHKVRKSKAVRGLESDETVDFKVVPDDILKKRQRIEANIIRVLKKLSRKHRD